MKGPEATRSLLKRDLFYLYEGPRDHQKPLNKEFVLPIWRAQRPPEAFRRGIRSTYKKGPETTRSLRKTDLFYLYEGPEDHQKPSEEEFVLSI